MGFDYDKIKHRTDEAGNFWTAYSDLFTVLSIVFLLLYVVASVRSGTFSIQKQAEYQRLSKKAEDLEEQIRVYNALRDEQVAQASQDEQKQYEQLMGKLSLLQDEAKEERNELIKQARENDAKAQALNKYQQMIRNIINVNMLAKRQIKQRDTLIANKDSVITDRESQIQELSGELKQNKNKITVMNRELEQQIRKATEEQKRAKTSKKLLEKRIAALRERTAKEVQELEARNKEVAQELTSAKTELAQTAEQLDQTAAQLSHTSQELNKTSVNLVQIRQQSAAEKAALLAKSAAEREALVAQSTAEREALVAQSNAERDALVNRLEAAKGLYEQQMAELKAAGEAKAAAERAAFQKSLNAAQLSGKAKAQKEAEFRARAEAEAQALKGELANLGSKIRSNEAALNAAREKEGRYTAAIGNLQKQNKEISSDLARAKELADAKKKLVQSIKENFRKAGVGATVDDKTGEVTLSFGDDYFETGSSDLKPTMRQRLEKFIPEYTNALFSDPKTSDKIANVEIVGFASSTYKGKYVNPQSLKPQDREAVDYNLKLSFSRANAIFKHIFDPNKLQYPRQKQLLPMVKVVGRGYLPDGKSPGDIPDGLPESEFCKRYNCKQAQRVIIKFNLKD